MEPRVGLNDKAGRDFALQLTRRGFVTLSIGTPAGVVVNARASDGVIEGMESAKYRFCLGVQWHPEFAISSGDERIFAAFIGASR